MNIARKSTLISLVLVFTMALTSCGLNKYADAVNTALGNFNSAGNDVTNQLMMINDDNSIISDPAWQADTLSALDKFDATGKAFANLPPTPAGYEEVSSLLTELGFETNTFVTITKGMINSGDINQMDSVNESLAKVNDLVTKVDDAIQAANK